MKKIVLGIVIALVPTAAFGAGCAEKVCIAVVTDPSANQIVITATQNKAGSTTKPKVVKPKVAKPKVATTPRPVVKKTYKPVVKTVKKVVPKKAVTLKPKVKASVSLSDRITQLLPSSHIIANPTPYGLVQVPTYFYTDAQPTFATTSMVVVLNVAVNLTPTFNWDFGDGSTLQTSIPGRAYPDKTIGHIYKKAGTYPVTLTISWGGTWGAEGNTYAIQGGNIVQTISTAYQVVSAPTTYVK